MKKSGKFSILSLSVAIFAMFFGAGNIIFPLIIGKTVGAEIGFGLMGFVITAVMVPILGFIAMTAYEGDYERFFLTLGKFPGLFLIALIMIIIGPFAASRCVIISYAAIQQYLPFNLFIYTLIIAGIVFALTMRESKVVPILGRVLGPIKISLLGLIVVLVVVFFKRVPGSQVSSLSSFIVGLKEGYYTLDLLGAFFFSHLIYEAMKDRSHGQLTLKQLVWQGTKAGLLGGLFLGIIYGGFGLASAIHSQGLTAVADENLFSAVAQKVLGDHGSIMANVTVALATLTTSLALTTVFADYLHNEIFKQKFSYIYILIGVILVNIVIENLEFKGVMAILGPAAILLYPAFIVLCVVNLMKKYWGFTYVKTIVLLTFLFSVFFQYIYPMI